MMMMTVKFFPSSQGRIKAWPNVRSC